ncbi:MAG TPA: hypothetical protein VKA49_16550 [Flavitalea sp.]|nr:hypothetical protein [Flavitalea sp.]
MNLDLQYYHGFIDISIDDSMPNQFNRVLFLTVAISIGRTLKRYGSGESIVGALIMDYE